MYENFKKDVFLVLWGVLVAFVVQILSNDLLILDPKFSLVTAENTVALILLVVLIVLACFWFLKPQKVRPLLIFP